MHSIMYVIFYNASGLYISLTSNQSEVGVPIMWL